jgi:hypothetical protein
MIVGPFAASRRTSESLLFASATPTRRGDRTADAEACLMVILVYEMTMSDAIPCRSAPSPHEG